MYTEEEDDDDSADNDVDAPGTIDDASSTATTANTIPTDTVDMMTYEVVGEYSTVDSTAVDEEREVVAESSLLMMMGKEQQQKIKRSKKGTQIQGHDQSLSKVFSKIDYDTGILRLLNIQNYLNCWKYAI